MDFVFIGRIHPKKNLRAQIAGWTASGAGATGARLRIAGWGDDRHVAELREMIAAAGDSAAFLGPVYGAAKADLLGAARFIVLPSLSEGLPMAILEAWAAGVPTVMSRACNLDGGFAAGAALDCGTNPDAIAVALRRALAVGDEQWCAMAGAARHLAAGAYAPDTIAESWAGCYRAAIADASRGAAA
jgi:poly(glycerol-phosphate) alpha-glucosyltransferase